MTIQEKNSPPKRRIPADVIDVEAARTRWHPESEEGTDGTDEQKTPGTEIVISKKTELEEKLLEWSRDAMAGESTVEGLDTKNKTDAQIAKVKDESAGDLIDIARLGGRLSDNFCVAPIAYSGQILTRRWHVANGDVFYFIGRSVRINRWSMYFEPGTVMGPQGGDRKKDWRTSELPIPHVPMEYRAATTDPRFLVWSQSWDSNILLPTNPVVIDHVAGDVYRLVGGWEFSALEIAAMRKVR